MIIGMAAAGFFQAGTAEPPRPTKPALNLPTAAGQGEFGSSLGFLRKHYFPARSPGEGNYILDLWAEQSLRQFIVSCGLTNNHALFINSHGKSMATQQGTRYACYAHPSILAPNEKAAPYSVADIALLIGPRDAAQIHNVLVSSCNSEGAFSTKEVRKYFCNATNIIHMPAGELGYQSMFRQILTTPSCNIKAVYETVSRNSSGKLEYFVANDPSPKATRLSPYIAELFEPGKAMPFKTQIAGREILAPENPSLMSRISP